jgi:hypothetical protein
VLSGNVDEVLTGLKKGVAALVCGALAVAVLVLASSPASAGAATLLYPNLKTLAPRDLRFDRADVDAAGGGVMHNVLRFSNTVWTAVRAAWRCAA